MKKKDQQSSDAATAADEDEKEQEDNMEEESYFDEDKNVDFCVNVDIGGWGAQMTELKNKVPEEFMCQSEHDILKHSQIDILGVTKPQVYLKVKGNWTGGH